MGSLHHEDFHVLIVGAGITGALLAQGLKKHNIGYTLFESDPSHAHHRREWSTGIHWSLPMLEALLPKELFVRLNSTQPDPSYEPGPTFDFYNGQTGEVINTVPAENMRRYSRTKLRNLVLEGIDVQYNKKLESVAYSDNGVGVMASFADGTSTTGTLLVGCDGARSRVRTLLLGAEKSAVQPCGFKMAIASSTYTAEQAMYLSKRVDVLTTGFHPNNTYCLTTVQDMTSTDPTQWSFLTMHSSMPLDFEGDEKARLALLKECGRNFASPWKEAIEWMPEDTVVYLNDLSYWETIPFDNHGGRVTLAGDAAHPMTPQRGQGLNNGICDIKNLVDGLVEVCGGNGSLVDVVGKYGNELVERGSREVKAAVKNTEMVHDWETLMQSDLMRKSVAQG